MAKRKTKITRIDWAQIDNLDCVHLVNHGLHGSTIARATGLSVGQIYYRAKRMGIRLRDYRDGRGPVAATMLRTFTVKKMSIHEKAELEENVGPQIEAGLKKLKKK